jgi:hypothetical protein
VSAHALRIVRPPEIPLEAPRQVCFGFLGIVVVVHFPGRRVHGQRPGRRQAEVQMPLELAPRAAAARAPIRRAAGLRQFAPMPIHGPRPKSLGTHRVGRAERAEMKLDVAALTRAGIYRRRPKTFGDCKPGPCPWVSCRHHLKLEIDPVSHSVKDNFPGIDVDEMPETCSLRVAALVREGQAMPLQQVGAYANLTMERARQLEKQALANMRAGMDLLQRIPATAPPTCPSRGRTPSEGMPAAPRGRHAGGPAGTRHTGAGAPPVK